eukprot:CAMPEP_0173430768 /NCGR_PEP_ID=MMETSP1357-20121228/9110_1 /TAXON_ID=77926 /ORGANISM="Hemiselmis rufescens, Strain PCC563" /LENGTH=69 /DNA_ID=CAMNT_0014395163 /DNA_START=206 /DNA_END=412 /DNA_ORIENTATION=-
MPQTLESKSSHVACLATASGGHERHMLPIMLDRHGRGPAMGQAIQQAARARMRQRGNRGDMPIVWPSLL